LLLLLLDSDRARFVAADAAAVELLFVDELFLASVAIAVLAILISFGA
jgi:hypothetical protein